MPQEIVTQPRAVRRALDQPRNIGDDEGIFIIFHDAQIGGKRSKMIIGDLGFGGGYFGKQRALAHVGEPDDA